MAYTPQYIGTGAGIGGMFGGPPGAAAGAVVGGLAGFLGGGGGDEYQQPEWYQKLLPEEFAPRRIPGREAEFYRAPQYPWAQQTLERGYGFLGGTLEDIQAGRVPEYLTRMGQAIREPAVAELEAGFGRAAGLMGETIAGRGLRLQGGAGQAGARALGGEFARARGGLEQDIARQMFGETAGIARQLPSWLMQMGQIAPPSQFVGPTEQWWEPGIYGWQPPAGGGGTQTGGGFDIGQALPYLMAGRTAPTQQQFGGGYGGGYGGLETGLSERLGSYQQQYPWLS